MFLLLGRAVEKTCLGQNLKDLGEEPGRAVGHVMMTGTRRIWQITRMRTFFIVKVF
jgi:hypothetical protein